MSDLVTWLWLIAGIVLIATELFIPGLVVCFLGFGAVIVAILRWFGLFTGFAQSFIVWLVTSIALLIALRSFLLKWVPSESTYTATDEDFDAVGSIVEVVQEVSDSKQGRIRYAGTTWPAITRHGILLAGTKAKLLYRDNLVWVIEPHRELPTSEKSENTLPPS
jgi:inner membrane protein